MTVEVDDKVIKRIQNLLEMTVENGCSEAEATNAAERARELLIKHKLELEQVKGNTETQDEELKEAWTSMGIDPGVS